MMGIEIEARHRAKNDRIQEMAERTYQLADGYDAKQNLRQSFARAKGSTPELNIPEVQPCPGQAPDKINVYSDGSLINVKASKYKLGGAGVWWEGRILHHQPLSEAESILGIPTQEAEGLGLAVAIIGFGGSSTRSEIAAGIIAMAADCQVNIGTDSQAFQERANSIIDMERRGKKPKRPWSSQKDGDLWITFHKML